MSSQCPQGHRQSWQCHKPPPITCTKCERDAKVAEEKRQKEFAIQRKRDAEQREHARRLAQIDDQIASETQALRDAQLAKERAHAIQQREKDLEEAASFTARASSTTHPIQQTSDVQPLEQTTDSRPKTMSRPEAANKEALGQTAKHVSAAKPSQSILKSSSQQDWQHMKDIEGASNDTIDAIMNMIGLEEVKAQVLRIKSKIDVTKRQNTSLKDERFNIVLLGNPGTGNVAVFFFDNA